MRHNEVRDTTADMLSEVCNDVRVELSLTPVTGERFTSQITEENACTDVVARGFWSRGQLAFADVRIFYPIAK